MTKMVICMGTAFKLLILLTVLLSSACKGRGAISCDPSDIVVEHSKTGRRVESKPEYEVTVTNNCECAQSKVLLKCFGLSSITLLDHTVIRPVDDENCVLYDGNKVVKGSLLKFNYAWITPQDFPFVNSTIEC